MNFCKYRFHDYIDLYQQMSVEKKKKPNVFDTKLNKKW